MNQNSDQSTDWEYSKRISSFGANAIVAGLVLNPENSLYQTWVSLYGNEITCLSAHYERADANEVLKEFCQKYAEGDLQDADEVTDFLSTIAMDEEPAPLPKALLLYLYHELRVDL